MRNYPFMQDLDAQKLLTKHGGSIGFDRYGRPSFQFKSGADYQAFVKDFEQTKKNAGQGALKQNSIKTFNTSILSGGDADVHERHIDCKHEPG